MGHLDWMDAFYSSKFFPCWICLYAVRVFIIISYNILHRAGHYFIEQRHDYDFPHVFRVQYCRNHLRHRTLVIDIYFPRVPNDKRRLDYECSEENGFDNSADDTVFDHDCREA